MPSVRRLPLAVATALVVAVAVPSRSLRAQDPGLPPVPALLGAKPAVAAPMAAAKAAPQREWIVVLRDPPQFDQPFDVRHRGLAPAASAALRQEEIAQATARYHAACAPLAVVLEGLGAADVRHFPLLGMFACRLGDGEASALAAWRCVGSVTPAMSVKPQRRVVRASDPDVIQPNHHAAVVAHRVGWTGANGSSLLAILDAWISVTDDGAGYTTHQMFRQGSVPNAASRIVASWNIPASQPSPPAPTAQGLPYNMDHGLGMAAVAAGAACAIPEPLPFADGQAPAASLVDINIVRPVPPATASCFNAPPSPGAAPQSVTDAYGCYAQDTDILAALNLLPTIVLSNPTRWVRIANLSYGGSTNPNHALPTAIDALAANWDILVVTPAGNYDNPSVPFESINACNGLAVGSTMRTPASGTTPAHPASAYSGRGPLLRSNTFPPCAIGVEYWTQYFTTVQGGQVTPFQMQADAFGRQFPDLGACGESLLAPTALASSNHLAANGSSLSAAVVSGALTLLLNGRDGRAPPALSVLEAKAIVLATADNANPNGLGDDARGAGFLRTDRLTNEPIVDASYVVKRLTVPNVVTPTGPAPQVASFVVEAGGRYSVALTWLRRAPGVADATAPNWADLDLVLEGPAVPGGSLVARSAVAGKTESNRTWERLEFTAAQSGQVVARARVVRAEVGGTTPAAVHAAVAVVTHERRLPSDPLAGATLVPRPVACVLRTEASVPAAAASLPFGLNFVPRALDGYTQVALPLQVESGAAAPSGEVVELALRGRFFASKVVACELWDGVPYQLGACTILRPHAPLARSRLVVDAAAGVATARFHAAELAAAAGASTARYLVFTLSPEMQIYMPATLNAASGYVSWHKDLKAPIASNGVGGWDDERQPVPNGQSACVMLNKAKWHYDLTWTRTQGAPTSPNVALRRAPNLRVVGDAVPGRSLFLTAVGLDVTAPRHVAALVTDLDPSPGPECGSIYKPATSVVTTQFVSGPRPTTDDAIAFEVPIPVDPVWLGRAVWHQIVVSPVRGGGAMGDPAPTAQAVKATIGW